MTLGIGANIKDSGGGVHYVFLPETPSKGDLIVGTALTTQAADRLAVGADTFVLTADSAQTLGVKWAAPTTGTVTSVATGTGLTGGPITTTGTVSVATNGITYALMQQANAQTLLGNPTGSTANVQEITLGTGLSFSGSTITVTVTGTVTSVGISGPSIITWSNTPVTTSGTLTGTLANQNANTVLAGPPSGAATTPTFRSLVLPDLPGSVQAMAFQNFY
jgi:hypothetical protein